MAMMFRPAGFSLMRVLILMPITLPNGTDQPGNHWEQVSMAGLRRLRSLMILSTLGAASNMQEVMSMQITLQNGMDPNGKRWVQD